jgi:hypothetical protein
MLQAHPRPFRSGHMASASDQSLARRGIVASRLKCGPLLRNLGLGLAALFVVGIGVAEAWPRKDYSDAEIVSRAELIVVGRMKAGSLTLVPHRGEGGAGASWEHHLRLDVAEVLKGTNSAPVITIRIGYGLEPIRGGYSSNQFGVIIITNIPTYRRYDRDAVQVFDRGNSAGNYAPVSGDIRTNQIWLLRRTARAGTPDLLGVQDPEDIQSIGRRAELLKVLRR